MLRKSRGKDTFLLCCLDEASHHNSCAESAPSTHGLGKGGDEIGAPAAPVAKAWRASMITVNYLQNFPVTLRMLQTHFVPYNKGTSSTPSIITTTAAVQP